MPAKLKAVRHDWYAYKKQYFASPHDALATFFKEELGWTQKKVECDWFRKNVKGWKDEKDSLMLRKTQAELLDRAGDAVQKAKIIYNNPVARATAQLSKFELLEALGMAVTQLSTKVKAEQIDPMDLIKQAKSIRETIQFFEDIELGKMASFEYKEGEEQMDVADALNFLRNEKNMISRKAKRTEKAKEELKKGLNFTVVEAG